MRAVIHGFLGRDNFGDDLMLHQHVALLRRLGFDSIGLSTSGATPEQLAALKRQADELHCHVQYGWTLPDLLIVGGGSLPPGFGLLEATFARTGKTKTALSSVSYPALSVVGWDPFLRGVFDLFLIRDDSFEPRRGRADCVLVPDVAASFRAASAPSVDRVAVVIRQDQKVDASLLEFDFAYDVLVLSDCDLTRSKEHCDARRATLIDMTGASPPAKAEMLCRYKRILSLGRLHAAVVGVANGIETIVVRLLSELPRTWEELRKHAVSTGKYSSLKHVADSPTLEPYVEAFSRLL